MRGIGHEVGFLVRRTSKWTQVAHPYDGKDTHCRMWSTGGMRKSKYDYYATLADLLAVSPNATICTMCAARNATVEFLPAGGDLSACPF